MSYRTLLGAVTLGSALAVASVASASSYFGNQMVADMDAKVITLDTVTTDAAGFVVIYDFTGGEFGAPLGAATLNEGANSGVVIGLSASVIGDLMAVMYAGTYDEAMLPDPSTGVTMLEIDVQD